MRRYFLGLLIPFFLCTLVSCTRIKIYTTPPPEPKEEEIVSVSIKPWVMLLIDEKNIGAYNVHEAEMTIIQFLTEKGISVIDPDLVKTNIERDKALQALVGSKEAAAGLGLQFGADVIIVGWALAKGSAGKIEGTSLRSYQANMTAKAIRTDTAVLLASETCRGVKVHRDDIIGGAEAIKAASQGLISKLYPKIIKEWAGGKSVTQKIRLVIGDVKFLWQLASLRKAIKEKIPGTQELIQRSFVRGVAIFEVKTIKDSQFLAEELVLLSGEDFRLQVISISPNKVDLKLVP